MVLQRILFFCYLPTELLPSRDRIPVVQHYSAVYLQALGESVIRKALEELQVWGLERRFTLYSYSSTAGTK